LFKLTYDLVLGWFAQNIQNVGLWFTSLFLALPICVLAQLFFIQKAYLDPTFTGIENVSLIRNVVLYQDDKYQAIEHYMAEAIVDNWPAKVIYERSKWAELQIGLKKQLHEVSFISGGYKSLGIKPSLGNFDSMNFPTDGSQIFVAISHDFWNNQFERSKNVIGQTIVISGKPVTISAVMPASFQSFRRGHSVDIVIPFVHLTALNFGASKEILPDTQSYIVAEESTLNNIENSASHYLVEEALLFDDAEVILNSAIGVDSLEFITVSKRINILIILFISLLVFCLIAFVTFFVGTLTTKQKDHLVRRLCGANELQLAWQKYLDILLTVAFVIACCTLLFPVISLLVQQFLPQVNADYFTFPWKTFIGFILLSFALLSLLIVVVTSLQFRLFTSYVGRGQTVSFGQKLQSYFLTALLVCISSFALLVATTILKYQYELNDKGLGFQVSQRFITNVEFPKTSNQTFFANNSAQLLLQNLVASAAIQDAALMNIPPFLDKTSYSSFFTPELKPIGNGPNGNVLLNYISPNYFEVMGQNVNQGKTLTWGNYWQVVVNKTLWDRYLSQYSLAEAKLVKFDDAGEKFALEIVGVVEDAYLQGKDRAPQPIVYRTIMAMTGYESIIVKSKETPAHIESALNISIKEVDVSFGEFRLESLEKLALAENAPRDALLSVSIIGALIMFLSTLVYTYSSVAQLVKKGAREIALRNSLGAKLIWLTTSEFKLFLLLLAPLSMALFIVTNYYQDTLLSIIFEGTAFNLVFMLLPLAILTMFIFIIFVWQFHKRLENVWNDLT
jgi:putative ABC transport system permease protein